MAICNKNDHSVLYSHAENQSDSELGKEEGEPQQDMLFNLKLMLVSNKNYLRAKAKSLNAH